MLLILKLFFPVFVIPILNDFETRDITIILIIFFILVILFSLIIIRKRRKKMNKILLDSKPYSTLLESDEELVSKGYERLYRGDIEGAIQFIDKAIKIRPEKEERYYMRGKLKISIGDYEGAIVDFSKTISLDSRNAYAYYQRGYAKKELGLLTEAHLDMQQAEKLGYTPPAEQTTEDQD